jgi:hypothetical protein
VIPLAWLGLFFDRKPAWRDRALLLSWFGSFFLFHCFYEPYDSFAYLRFLLPAAPGLIIGAAIVVRGLVEGPARPRVMIPIAAVLLLTVLFAESSVTRSVGILTTAEGESIYPRICSWASRTLPADAVVLSMAASGALEHYTNLSYARYERIEPERYPGLRASIARRGSRIYALLFPYEVELLLARVPGRWKKVGVMRDVTLWKLED